MQRTQPDQGEANQTISRSLDLDQPDVPEPVAPALSILYGRYCIGHAPALLSRDLRPGRGDS